MDTLVEIWINSIDVSIDRNYEPITAGQKSDVVLRFHFDESWATRTARVVSLLNGNRIYTQPMKNDVIRVPKYMITEGCLKFIVRGFMVTDENFEVVRRDGHFVVTDSPQPDDLPGYSYTVSVGNFSVSDQNSSTRKSKVRKKPNTHIVTSDEVLYSEINNIQPVAEDELGYMEASMLDEEAIYIGRKRI